MKPADRVDFGELESYYRDLHRFGVRLSKTAIEFEQLVRAGKWPEREVPFVYNRNDPRDILNRSIDITREFEFLVAVTGAFSSGKSTLLNVLLNCPDLLPASAIPLTATCTVIRRGTTPQVKVRYAPLEECMQRIKSYLDCPFLKEFHRPDQIPEAMAKPENFVESADDQKVLRRFAELLDRYEEISARRIPFAERAPFMAGGGTVSSSSSMANRVTYFVPTPGQEREYLAAGGDPARWVTREWLALIRDVTLHVDSPLLENNIVFLDLPGLNCREDYHRRAIHEYCNMADCIVVTSFQPGNQADEQVVQNFKSLSTNFREKLFFVFNRVDQFQTEPQELVRSFDYLLRDCIGQDFPGERCFLTSAYLARESVTNSTQFHEDFDRFARAFRDFHSGFPLLDELVEHAAAKEDPGGIGYFRRCIQSFLREDAYRTKIGEILLNYDTVVGNLQRAASPHYEDFLRQDQRELRLRSVLDYLRQIERLTRSVLYAFRYDYLRGSGSAAATLSRDIEGMLERTHQEIERTIGAYFSQPIATAPPREDPIQEFELRRIADDASSQLRRQFQETVTSTVLDGVRQRVYEHLNRCKIREHVKNLFAGDTEWMERLGRIIERFEFMLRHSILCKVRGRFYSMPGGRDLKRLERSCRLADARRLLTEVFTDFYPTWIYQNVYGELQDGLWLSFFLDTEELETELKKFFDGCQGFVTSPEILERVRIPDELGGGLSDLYQISEFCRDLSDLLQEKASLESRNTRSSLAYQV